MLREVLAGDGVGQRLVRLHHELGEELARRRVRVLIRVIAQRHLPVRALDLLVGGARLQLQDAEGVERLRILRSGLQANSRFRALIMH